MHWRRDHRTCLHLQDASGLTKSGPRDSQKVDCHLRQPGERSRAWLEELREARQARSVGGRATRPPSLPQHCPYKWVLWVWETTICIYIYMRSGRNTLLGPSTFLNVIVFGGDLIVLQCFRTLADPARKSQLCSTSLVREVHFRISSSKVATL